MAGRRTGAAGPGTTGGAKPSAASGRDHAAAPGPGDPEDPDPAAAGAAGSPDAIPGSAAHLLRLLTRTACHVYSGYLLADGEYEELFTGPGLEELLGRPLEPAEDLTAAWHGALHPEDWDTYQAAGVQLETDATVSIEYRLVQPDGGSRWVLDRMWLRDRMDSDRMLVDGVVTDVTELHERSEQVRDALHRALDAQKATSAAQGALAQTSALLHAAVEASPAALVVVDPAGAVRLWNPAAERMFGWPREEVLGRRAPHVPEDRRRAYREQLTAIADAMAHSELEEVRVTKGGDRRQVAISSAPVRGGDGALFGLLGVITDITERKEMEARLRQLAHADLLTGLANRAYLGERIAAALASRQQLGGRVSLLLLDLDGFKAINDSFGHAVGDELLVTVADRLRACLRAQDLPARLGGDEFAVLLEGVPAAECARVADRVLAAVAEPAVLTRCEASLSASIGLVHATPETTTEDLLRDADVAMYTAKAQGRNRVVVFQRSMQQRVATRLTLENDLRRAVEEGQFELHYQPFVHLETGDIVGVEALVRWAHPERGLLAPGEFISVAEETGVVVPLGRWVIEEACRTAARWQRSSEGRMVAIAVNLSPRQLHDAGLLAHVAQALTRSGLPANVLEVEITENLLMSEDAYVGRRLTDLRDMGVRVAVDDFGTGYSSLAYLRRYPVDLLKIDRSFVTPLGRGPKPAALVRSIVELARALDLDLVAEGVETAQQAAALRRLGCRVCQGFYFHRPEPAEAIDRLLLGDGLPLLAPAAERRRARRER